ncbi:rust resistance kinase Lr10-like isoform X2 [Magnolia sinica]|uniref:rust resistance kinase Lr10-like isoform X2 n=1 Tax=Magnolia sinica TaxID=86752 RepID=UPI0026581D13|nr:rust resistance kinase Lr10-like isoform X2 [Magnolia sinica]
MGWLKVFFFLSVFRFLTIASCKSDELSPNYDCSTTRCSRHGPKIRFPFRKQGSQQQGPWSSGFELSCKGHHTVLHIPSTGDVEVRRIDYASQTLSIVGSNGCVAGLLFPLLNLSSSPFNYSGAMTNVTFVNCSVGVDFLDGEKIACMSDWEHDVFLLFSDTEVESLPSTCQPTETVELPHWYWYGYGDGLLHLKWDMPGCSGCDEAKGGVCGFKDKTQSNETTCYYKCNEGTSLGSFFILVALLISLKFYHSWKLEREKDRENRLKVEKFLEDYKSLKPTRYSYADLKRMTDQFKEKLGQGGYGSVYKGTLANGDLVAVKILQKSGGDGEDFINEVGTIGRIHHINVVRLLGFCTDNLKRALIYEFMPNESLEKFIFSADAKNPLLSWEKLKGIAIGIARGIEYLHQGCDQRILHFDIKPHNILLDHNFNPKISDFGLAKLCSKGQSIVSMTAARGTMGYIAPEVFSRNFGNVSYKSDIYSFGMLLLEMVGGRKNIDVTVENTSQVYFPEWIYNRLHHGEELGLNIDAVEDANIAKKLTTVALWCIQWYPGDRPAIKSVVQMLEGSMESLMMPPNPFATSAPPNVDTTTPETTHAANLTTIAELEEGKDDDIS